MNEKVSQQPNNNLTIVLSCDKKDTNHLDSLCRYYEVGYEGIHARGVWLATLLKDAEIINKKLAVVEIDNESGEITSISPVILSS